MGNDSLYGYAGNDLLQGDEGNDTLGGAGDDTLVAVATTTWASRHTASTAAGARTPFKTTTATPTRRCHRAAASARMTSCQSRQRQPGAPQEQHRPGQHFSQDATSDWLGPLTSTR
ncbi:hypothetical protein [Pseudomonas aeruginosa]|uniref:hypothetical protein n=1 Tax=Pseudomonas aeruginosa TaxID=287 RepID=UPI0021BB377E|nr:hypothetical protein [Pseudomonas aeruginosa]